MSSYILNAIQSTPHLNMMGLIHSQRSPLGRRMPNVRVYPAISGSPNLLP